MKLQIICSKCALLRGGSAIVLLGGYALRSLLPAPAPS